MSLRKALILVLFLSLYVSSGFSAPLTIQTKGEPVPVRVLPDGTRVLGKATLSQHRGIYLLNLFGTREEMALQHGALAADQIQRTALPYFAQKIDLSVAQTYVVKQFPFLGGIIKTVIDWFIMAPLRGSLPDEDRKVTEALARGAGIDDSVVANALIMPDVGQYLVAKVFGDGRISSGTFVPPTGLGCSTLVASSQRTGQGLIHARNLDYEGYNLWEKRPAVLYFHPSEPGAQGYMSLTSLGIHTAGITSANDSGIILSLHQASVESTSLSQRPILSVTERVIRDAHNIGEAVSILASEKFATSWKVVISSARENRAVVVDVAAHGIDVTEMTSDHLSVTNSVSGPLMKPLEFSSTYENMVDSLARLKSLESTMLRTRRLISVQDGLDAISNPETFLGENSAPRGRAGPGAVAKLNNVQSVVFNPESNLVYMAVPTFEAQKPTDGRYVAIPTHISDLTDLDALNSALEKMPVDMARSRPLPRNKTQAQASYRLGAQKIADEGDLNEAAFFMLRAIELDPSEGIYALGAGLVFFKLLGEVEDGERWILLNRAQGQLEKALATGMSNYHKNLIQFFLARIEDLRGNREGALAIYGKLNTSQSAVFAAAVKKGIEDEYEFSDVKDLTVHWTEGDVFKF